MPAFILLSPALAATLTFAPGEDWCAAAQAAQPGDEIVLQPGDHAGPCVLSAGGTEGEPVTIRGEAPNTPPRIVYSGTTSNVVDVTASWVTVRGLAFGPTEADVDAIKVKAGDHVTVEGNTFTGVGGISVSANSVDTVGLTIRGNTFTELQATALYLGCHDGAGACTAADVVVADNLIDGVTSPAVGYGLEIKKDSWGAVTGNVIAHTQGPGLEVYGSEDGGLRTLVDGNFVLPSTNNASIEVAGPGVTVVDNVVIGGDEGAIYVYPYWEGVHDVIVEGNTVVGQGGPAVRLSDALTDARLRDNVGWQVDGTFPFPDPMAGVTAAGNVTCGAPEACWRDEAGGDFRPVEGGRLGEEGVSTDALPHDFCGVPRGDPPTVGAIEAGAAGPGPLTVALKSTFGCPDSAVPGDTGDSGTPSDSGAAGPEGCGCSHAAAGSTAGALLAAAALVRRRRWAQATSR